MPLVQSGVKYRMKRKGTPWVTKSSPSKITSTDVLLRTASESFLHSAQRHTTAQTTKRFYQPENKLKLLGYKNKIVKNQSIPQEEWEIKASPVS